MICPTCGESHPFSRFNIPADGAEVDGIRIDVLVELSFCSPSCRALWIVDYLLSGAHTQIPAHLMATLLTPAVAA